MFFEQRRDYLRKEGEASARPLADIKHTVTNCLAIFRAQMQPAADATRHLAQVTLIVFGLDGEDPQRTRRPYSESLSSQVPKGCLAARSRLICRCRTARRKVIRRPRTESGCRAMSFVSSGILSARLIKGMASTLLAELSNRWEAWRSGQQSRLERRLIESWIASTRARLSPGDRRHLWRISRP